MSYLLFILSGIFLVLLTSCYVWYKTKTSPLVFLKKYGSWTGIKGAILFAVIVGSIGLMTGCTTGTYLKRGDIFVGIDNASVTSPQCFKEGINNKLTSNLGAKLNLYTTEDNKMKTNLKYTHHSCVYNRDRNLYDAFGLELEYQLFNR